jgi:hypothetical protein
VVNVAHVPGALAPTTREQAVPNIDVSSAQGNTITGKEVSLLPPPEAQPANNSEKKPFVPQDNPLVVVAVIAAAAVVFAGAGIRYRQYRRKL